MSAITAVTGASIFDSETWHEGKSLVFEADRIVRIAEAGDIPADAEIVEFPDALIVPGFVDLQVNGGGGILFNETPTVDGIRAIIAAHARFGTTRLLPTLITDTPEVTRAALEAGRRATAEKLPGFLGLHLEGPHLSLARKGAHHPRLIRQMEEADLAALISYRHEVGPLLTTIAPENVTKDQVARLTGAGVIVSLGHTEASAEVARSYMDAGATMVTHLFNAMSPLGHREPGLVGAALDCGTVSAGLIADGFHVDPAAMRIAIRAKAGPGQIFLVTDSMSTIGTDVSEFSLNGRRILRQDGRLTLEDGTLAGADIDMLSSVKLVTQTLGLPLSEALRMASLYPAQTVGMDNLQGRLAPGFLADFVVLSRACDHLATFIGGKPMARLADDLPV